MVNVEINYIVQKPDENDDVVVELERILGELQEDMADAAPVSSSLDYESGVAVVTVNQAAELGSLAQYQHRADTLASEIVARCVDGMKDRVGRSFAGVMPPKVALQQD